MDANYLKHAVGPSLTAAISSLLAHPHPNQISDPIHHVARHLLHQDQVLNNQMAQKKKLGNIQYMIDAEKARVKHINDCKKKIGMQLEEGIARMEQRALDRKTIAENDAKQARDDAEAVAAAEAAASTAEAEVSIVQEKPEIVAVEPVPAVEPNASEEGSGSPAEAEENETPDEE